MYFIFNFNGGPDLAQCLLFADPDSKSHLYTFSLIIVLLLSYLVNSSSIKCVFLLAGSVSSSLFSKHWVSPEWRWLMIEALCEIKQHPDDNGLFGGLDDGRKEEWWVGGRRERCCRSKNTKGGSEVNTSHHSHVILTETNAGCSEVMLCVNVNSVAGRNIRGNWCNECSWYTHLSVVFFSLSSRPVNSCSLMWESKRSETKEEKHFQLDTSRLDVVFKP